MSPDPSQVASADSLKHEILRLEKEIREEQVKTTALFHEAEHPINVHRWRQIESSRPDLFAKILRVQSLHKRLIQCSDDITQREVLTAEKEKLYRELKTVLDRQPGAEVSDNLNTVCPFARQGACHWQCRARRVCLSGSVCVCGRWRSN